MNETKVQEFAESIEAAVVREGRIRKMAERIFIKWVQNEPDAYLDDRHAALVNAAIYAAEKFEGEWDEYETIE